MPSPTSATLSGPVSGECNQASTDFTVTLDQPADTGGVVVTVTSTVGGDTITSTPFTIAAGVSSGTFKLTPSSGGNRDISISTAPTLTVVNSPWTYLAKSPPVVLSGPSSGDCSIASTNFTVSLTRPACTGGTLVTVTSSDGSDVITPSSFTIAAGTTTGTFTVTPNTCGNRTISIATSPVAVATTGSPKTYGSNCACPDNAGTVNRSQAWTKGTVVCGDAFSVVASVTPSTIQAKDLYCGTSTLSMTFTE